MSAARAAASGPTLLPGPANPSAWLALAMLVLSLVAAFELVAATAAVRAAIALSPRLAGSLTVAVGGGGLESTEAATARASEILANVAGVTKITVLDPDQSDTVVGGLMGLGLPAARGDPPRLIAATIEADRGSAATIAQSLRRENVVAVVDDHGVWSGPLEHMAVLAAGAAGALLLVLVAVTWALAAGSAGAAFDHRQSRVDLLMRLGATEGMLVKPFRTRVVGATALGALIGAGAAAALAAAAFSSPAVAAWIGSHTGAAVGPAPGLDAWDLAAAAIWPPLAILIAAWAAAGAARARLRALA